MVFYEDDLFLVFKIMMYVRDVYADVFLLATVIQYSLIQCFQTLWNITTSLKVDCIFSQTF